MQAFKRPFGVGAAPGLWMLTPRTLVRIARTAFIEPRYFACRLRLALWQASHPGWPWLTPEANRFLSGYLQLDMTALEFGSGRSTAWLGRRCRHLTSVEDDPEWQARVALRVSGLPVDLKFVPPGPDHAARYAGIASLFPDGSLDLVVVDGAHRNACIQTAAPKVRKGGVMVVDNADMRYLDVVPLAHDFERTSTFDGVDQTDFYIRRGNT